jgi:O-antigen polymerase
MKFNKFINIAFIAIFGALFFCVLFDKYLLGYNTLEDKVIAFNVVSCLCIIVVCSILFFKRKLSLDLTDILFLLFILYINLDLFLKVNLYNNFLVSFSLCVLVVFLCKQVISSFQDKALPVFWLSASFLASIIIEAFVAIYQLYDLAVTSNSTNTITGTFNNAGVLAIFLGAGLVFSLSIYFFAPKDGLPSKIIRAMSIACLFLTIIVLPSTQSRTTGVAIIIVAFILAINKYQLFKKTRTWITYIIYTAIALLIIIASVFFYNYKKDSADGRIVIWSTTTQVIKKNALTGVGFNQFQNKFPDFQLVYFKAHPAEGEKFADKNDYVFNDFLQITSENGLIGAILFCFFCAAIFNSYLKNELKNEYVIGSFFGFVYILICAFTSYPFEIISIWFEFVFFAAIVSISYAKARKIEIGMIATCIFAAAAIGSCLYVLSQQNNAVRSRDEIESARQSVNDENYQDALNDYNAALSCDPDEKGILLESGKCDLLLGYNNDCIKTLTSAEKYISDPFLSTNLAGAYQNNKNFQAAESNFIKAIEMMPNRIYPRYLLIKMYVSNGQYDKAKIINNEIDNMHLKLESAATIQMKSEIRRLLDHK